jgi:RNA polymerase sigma factor (sigma-70 family)
LAHRSRVFPVGSRMRLGLASDEWLVGCVRRGDTAAFEALYDRHVRELLGFCMYMLGSRQDAEDAVQATFASAYRALRADSRPVALRPWLFAIARNDCLSILRRRRPVVELGGEVASGPDPAATAELREEVRRVFEGLRELPERQRAALVLAEVHGLSQAEIGEVLGVRADQVKAFVYQARSTLISERRARDSDCREIREQLAGARGAALLRGRLRRHVRSCADCRTYADGVARQRTQLGALLPIAPSLALKYRALEEALSIGSSDPATVAGGATVGATMAGTAAEFAGGGMNALVCKLAVGMVCVGASAGVGVSVLGGPAAPAEGQAAMLAAGSSPALLSASAGGGGSSLSAADTPLLRDLHSSSEQRSVGDGQAPASGSLPEVQNGLAADPTTDGDGGGGTAPVLETGQPAPAASGVGGGDPAGDGGGASGEVQRRAAAQQRGREHEARRQLIAERRKAKEERVHEGGSKAPPSEEELALKHAENQHRREERKPEGHSKPPPTEEQLALKKEKTEKRRAEKRREREEEAAPPESPAP